MFVFLHSNEFETTMIQNLLIHRAYGNGEEDELWQALQDQVDEDQVVLPAKVKEIMDTWVLQMGA